MAEQCEWCGVEIPDNGDHDSYECGAILRQQRDVAQKALAELRTGARLEQVAILAYVALAETVIDAALPRCDEDGCGKFAIWREGCEGDNWKYACDRHQPAINPFLHRVPWANAIVAYEAGRAIRKGDSRG